MAKTHIGELVFFWVLFAIVGYLTFSIMSPYFTALFLSLIFGVLFAPVFRYLRHTFKMNESRAALATVILVLFTLLVPLLFIGAVLFEEVALILKSLSSGDSSILLSIDTWTAGIESQIQRFVPDFRLEFDIYSSLLAFLSWMSGNLDSFFSGIMSFFLDVFLVVIALFFFFRDGQKLRDFAIKWSPMSDRYDESIISKLEIAVTSVVRGTLVTAIAQGAFVGVGFLIFGVPSPVLWSLVATIAALIPMVGTGIVTFPAAFYLIATGSLLPGVGLLLWGILIVGLLDNVLRPILMNRGMHIHSFLILLSVFGGLVYFGPIGFLAGPIVLAFFFVLLNIYPDIVSGKEIQ